jgi:hypothetical protein
MTPKHEAALAPDGQRVVFAFEHGYNRLAGQVSTVEEYRALLVLFQGWHGTLPAPQLPDWIPGLEPLADGRAT